MKFRYRLAQYFSNAIERRAERVIVERFPVLYRDIADYRTHSPSTGCTYADYLAHYTWIRRHKPREILECGTGVSTVVLARALMENEKEHGTPWRLVSMEENPSYYEAALACLPAHLKSDSRLEMVLSEAVEDTYEFFRGVRYKDVPKGAYDLVFVDGPDFMIHPGRTQLTFDFDFLKIVQDSERPVSAFIDTRMSTCFIYSLLFPGKVRYDFLRRIGIVAPVTRRDLADAKTIVSRAMEARAFRRPPLKKLITGVY